MLALGCLLPVLMVAAGTGIGAAMGSTAGGIWGGIAGFFLGCLAVLALIWGIEEIKQR